MGHEFLCPPNSDDTIALYAWQEEDPIFVGHISRTIGHWQDSIDVQLTPSPEYYKSPEKQPDKFLLRFPLDLICLSAVQSLIHRFRLRLDRQLRVDKCFDHLIPVYYFPTLVPGTNEVYLRPLTSYDIPITSFVITVPYLP